MLDIQSSKNNTHTHRSVTTALNIQGWSHLDPILLAALAIESPLLLVGPHGTAKSLLVERLAMALNLSMRHYNAALINYDDLVGLPLPDKETETLKFFPTPSTIWDAGFVFFDEISRCRPDLQNKLYPIIHERRVVGIKLDKLRHRWSAMNPPAPEDPNLLASSGSYYLGSEPLDPALTDRFPFVVMVPNWSNLTKEEQRAVVAWDADESYEPYDIGLSEMVAEVAALVPEIEASFAVWLGDYIVSVMDLLEQAQLPQSPRRARMLARSVVAIHAARIVLEGDDIDPQDSAELALLYGMPQTANEVPPSHVKLIALHKQAWELAQYLEDDSWRQVLSEYDMARRVAMADELKLEDADISRIITQTISAENSDPRQMGLAVAMFLSFHDKRDLDPSAFEPLAQLAYYVLSPRFSQVAFPQNSADASLWGEIKGWIDNQVGREDRPLFRIERNYLLHGFPNWWRTHSWADALQQFQQDLKLFGIYEETLK
ncbi:MAG: MoxR family ATPase [Phototrophicales bacterium]|nr:MoxR family ATPase [Phototrophicales bacterium]